MHIPSQAKDAPYLRDTPNNEVSHFGVIPGPDCTDGDELVDSFDSSGYRRYHGLLINKRSMTTTLGSKL